MNYIPQTWIDGPSGGTPVDAARLGHMEDGILDASNRLGVVETSNATKDIAMVATGTKTATYNAVNGDLVLADASSGVLPIVLPAATPGLKVAVKKIDSTANFVAITAHAGDTIEGGSPINLRLQYETRTLIASNGSWSVSSGLNTITTLDARYALKLTPTAVQTAAYTAVAGDLARMDATSAARTVTLPAATVGAVIAVRKTDSSANTVTITPNGTDTIDGNANSVLRMPGEVRVMIGISGGWVTQSHSKSPQLQRLWNSGTLAPSATANTNGTAVNMTPTSGLTGFTGVLMARFNGTGTFGSETVTCTFTATFNDGTTTTTTLTATNTTPVLFAAANQIALAKDACFITQISVAIKSTIASSAARGNVDILALQFQ